MIKVMKQLKGTQRWHGAVQALKDAGHNDEIFFTPNELFTLAQFIFDNRRNFQHEHDIYKNGLFKDMTKKEFNLVFAIVDALHDDDKTKLADLRQKIITSNQRVRRVVSSYLLKNSIKRIFTKNEHIL